MSTQEKIKEYSNEEITVVWKPNTCIHSEKCWRGLGSVFNPKGRPWINIDGASAEALMAQIDQCPSGALSYRKKGENQADETAATLSIEAAKDGPLLVKGNFELKNSDGTESNQNKITALCRCGASANKPFCDGAHKKVGFEG